MLYKRVLLKVSGEALMGTRGFGIDLAVVRKIANAIVTIKKAGISIAVVIGGGNIARGVSLAGSSAVDRVSSDHMGMLATVINALALRAELINCNATSEVFSAIAMPQICEIFSQCKVMEAIEDGKIVVFAAGTGNPYFTTDTAATLRAVEIGADVLIKATQVDGIYDSDPQLNPSAKHLPNISYDGAIARNLGVMDITAIALAKENKVPIIVCSLLEAEGFVNILQGEGNFSLVN